MSFWPNFRQVLRKVYVDALEAIRVTLVVDPDEPIPVEITQNVEFDAADGNVSAVKALYKTINGVAPGTFDDTEAKATIIGISRNAATDGNTVRYITAGRFEDSSLTFAVNEPLYLSTNGNLTTTPPVTGFRTQVGVSLGVGVIYIQIEEPITL